jgi:uncharacterized protein (DUF302 family)
VALSWANDAFVLPATFEQSVSRVKRVLSKSGFEILQECAITPRVSNNASPARGRCRLMYISDPGLLAIAVAMHPSAALWLPTPVIVTEEAALTRVFVPVEALVRDRAALMGLQRPVQDLYGRLATALRTIGIDDAPE